LPHRGKYHFALAKYHFLRLAKNITVFGSLPKTPLPLPVIASRSRRRGNLLNLTTTFPFSPSLRAYAKQSLKSYHNFPARENITCPQRGKYHFALAKYHFLRLAKNIIVFGSLPKTPLPLPVIASVCEAIS